MKKVTSFKAKTKAVMASAKSPKSDKPERKDPAETSLEDCVPHSFIDDRGRTVNTFCIGNPEDRYGSFQFGASKAKKLIALMEEDSEQFLSMLKEWVEAQEEAKAKK